MTRYIISDTHFGHENIIEYCQRPFDSVEEMNDTMRMRWNNVVSPRDTVIHLGDVRHHPDPFGAADWLDRLNGEILLVRGNHDSGIGQNATVNTVTSCTIQHGRYDFYVEHQPVGASSWQLHGHAHNNDLVTYPMVHPGSKRVNVSAELLNYQPLKMDKLVNIVDRRKRYRDINEATNKQN